MLYILTNEAFIFFFLAAVFVTAILLAGKAILDTFLYNSSRLNLLDAVLHCYKEKRQLVFPSTHPLVGWSLVPLLYLSVGPFAT